MTSAFNRLEGLGVDERRAGGELCEFAHELPRLVRDDGFGPVKSATLRDFHLARKNDDQARCDFACLTMRSPVYKTPDFTEVAQAIDVRVVQSRKHLVVPRTDHRMRRLRMVTFYILDVHSRFPVVASTAQT